MQLRPVGGVEGKPTENETDQIAPHWDPHVWSRHTFPRDIAQVRQQGDRCATIQECQEF
jgi:hypothetical protein